MSRYIDAEFEIDHYTSMTTHPTPDVSEKDKRDSLIILEALRRAKSIDIVHCGECKRAEHEPSGVRCGLSDVLMGEDGFCSIGVRNADSNTFNTLDALDSSEKPNNLSEISTGSERSSE